MDYLETFLMTVLLTSKIKKHYPSQIQNPFADSTGDNAHGEEVSAGA
jgi:hypothetical protein